MTLLPFGQYILIVSLSKQYNWAVAIDRYPSKHIALGDRCRSIPLKNYYVEQYVSIDFLANLLSWAIGVDRCQCEHIELGNRYRSVSL